MSIRDQFQPAVDEFIDNLRTFATGSYLHEEEREFWDAPFDPEVLPQFHEVLNSLLSELDQLDDPDAAQLLSVITPHLDALATLNRTYDDAVIEPEEREELAQLIYDAAAATGAEDEALAQLPEFDQA